MKFRGLIIVLLLLGVMTVEARPKYRIAIKRIEGTLYFIPQIRTGVPNVLMNQWVDLANQPLRSQNEALNYIRESRIVRNQMRQADIIQYIKIK
jgi:hypothetical protein